MFGKDFFQNREPRKFGFTPYHYEADSDDAGPRKRIKFAAIRHRASVTRKSVKGMVLLAALLIFFLIYYWRTIEQAGHVYDLDGIKIEDAATGK